MARPTMTDKNAEREQIAIQMRQFEANGGKAKTIPAGVSVTGNDIAAPHRKADGRLAGGANTFLFG